MKKMFLLSALFLFVSINVSSQIKDTIKVNFNGFILEDDVNAAVDSQPGWRMNLRDSCNACRWGYMDFPLDKIISDSQKIELHVFFENKGTNINDFDLDENAAYVDLFGAKYPFDNTLTWATKTEPSTTNEVTYPTKRVSEQNRFTWLVWDVTDFIKERKEQQETNVYFRMAGGVPERKFILKTRQMHVTAETDKYGMYYPRLIQYRKDDSGMVADLSDDKVSFYITGNSEIQLSENVTGYVYVYNSLGTLVAKKNVANTQINVEELPEGVYLIKVNNKTGKFIKR